MIIDSKKALKGNEYIHKIEKLLPTLLHSCDFETRCGLLLHVTASWQKKDAKE